MYAGGRGDAPTPQMGVFQQPAGTPTEGLAEAAGFIARGQVARAQSRLEKLARAFPDDVEVMAALAVCAAASGDDSTFTAKRKRLREDWAAGRRPPGVISLLVRAMATNSPSLAHAAAALAIDLGDIAVGALLGIVERDAGVSAGAAMRALAALGVNRARPRLGVIANDRAAVARFDALEALARLGDPRGVSSLLEHANSHEPRIRANAASALGGTADLRAGDTLLGLTLDADDRVRAASALSLGELAASPFVFPLRRLLSDPEETVRVFAAGALAALDDTDGIPTLLASARPDAPPAARLAGALFVSAHKHRPQLTLNLQSYRAPFEIASPEFVAQIDADDSLARFRWRRWFARAV
jgi:hypothetical protein